MHGVDVAEDGVAVFLVAHYDASFPPTVVTLAHHAVAGRSALCHLLKRAVDRVAKCEAQLMELLSEEGQQTLTRFIRSQASFATPTHTTLCGI